MYSFSQEELNAMPEATRFMIEAQIEMEAERREKPIMARVTYITDGARTRDGGIVIAANRECAYSGWLLAAIGDKVVYQDGSESLIISGIGRGVRYRNKDGSYSSAAVIGSRLENGDVVVTTPATGMGFDVREYGDLPEGFLVDYFKAD